MAETEKKDPMAAIVERIERAAAKDDTTPEDAREHHAQTMLLIQQVKALRAG